VMSEPLNILGRGTTFLELSNNDLSNFILPLPTKETQMIIVSYLDQKCSEIDRIIHAKVEQNELLKEYRQSVIYEAVTKGLDKNVPMKDSGVEWIGEIPQGWSVMKLSSQVLLINTKVEFSGQKYIGLENVESWTGRYFDTDCMDSTGISNTFQDEDILFGKLRPYLAKCILAQFCGICSSEFLVLRTQNASNKYLAYTMLSKSFVNLVDSSTYGTKMPRANWSFIGNIQICVPTIEEQKLIADYLDLKCSQIDQIISANNSTIEELKDYRQSVIFEVVTGKKDLTNS